MSQATAAAFDQADAPHAEVERTPASTAGPCRNWSAERTRLNDPARARLTTAERVVLDAIEVHIADHEEGWPTQKRIATQTGLSERQVRRCVEVLERRGFLRVRIVLPGGALPSGTRTDSARLVYRRGPQLGTPGVVLPFPSPSSARRARGGASVPPQEAPAPAPSAADEHPDSMSACHPDSMSAKGSENLKEPNTPLPPREPAAARTPEGPRKCGVGSIPEETEPKPDEIRDVLAHWRSVLWPNLPGHLERPSRCEVIRERLGEGFTSEDLRWAIDAAKDSAWLQEPGQSHRLYVEVLFAKPERVGEFAARGRAMQESRERRARNLERERAARKATAEAPRERVSLERMAADVAQLFGPGRDGGDNTPADGRQRLTLLAAQIGRELPIKPPCHTAGTCPEHSRDCASACKVPAPLAGGAMFGKLRERARSPEGVAEYERQAAEHRERELARHRAEQLARAAVWARENGVE
jgi:hypothetical protein